MKRIIKIILQKIILFKIKKGEIDFDKISIVFAPHPDDETIGLGGIIQKIIENNKNVTVVFITNGEASEASVNKNEISKKRIELSNEVLRQLNVPLKNIIRLNISDGKIPEDGSIEFDKCVEEITKILIDIQPEMIFTTHISDFWPFDHVNTSKIVLKSIKNSNLKLKLYYYWVWTWYHISIKSIIQNNYKALIKVDISEQHKKKLRLINLYFNSFSDENKPWSGNIPSLMLKPFNQPFEIIEEIKYE